MKLLLSLMLVCSSYVLAKELKIAAIAPKGTNWAKSLQQLADEVEEKTDGGITFKIYFGGTAGDEPDVLRKIRIGQLHGGVFTGKTLGDISKNVRVIETPFTFFSDREKASKALKTMAPYFDKELKKKKFTALGYYEIGQVYLVSNKKVTNLEELKGIKVWSWEGDEVINAMIKSLELVSVPLSLPDVLPSLSTNIINAAYAPPLGIIALQWHSQIKYLVDFPTAFSMGALIIGDRGLKGVSEEHMKILKEVSKKYVAKANEWAENDNKEGLAILKQLGVEFIEFDKSDLAKAEVIRTDVLKLLKSEISDEAFKKLNELR
jgi:TRAP-type C4-dicarboxylate transport system substrate-binding protein